MRNAVVQPETDATLDLFRAAMERYPAAVCIITSQEGDEVAAMTATAVTSFTSSPPSILCSIDHSASSHPLLARSRQFALNVLSTAQADTARAFARSDVDKFDRPEFVRDGNRGDVPIISGALATIVCERDAMYVHFDHTILIGRITGSSQLTV